MVAQISLLGETYRTSKRIISNHDLKNFYRIVPTFLAKLAHIFLLRRVIPDVIEQGGFPAESLIADWAASFLSIEHFVLQSKQAHAYRLAKRCLTKMILNGRSKPSSLHRWSAELPRDRSVPVTRMKPMETNHKQPFALKLLLHNLPASSSLDPLD